MIPKPNIGEALASGSGNRQAAAHVDQIAMPGDRILQVRGGGDLGIYEQVLSDPQVASCFLQRRNAVTAREWQVEAGGKKRIDIKAANHLRAQLQRIGWDSLTDKMLYGVHYGFSVAELLWDAQDGLYGWKAIKVRRRRKFKFTNSGQLRRFDGSDPVNGVEAPAPYFWHFTTGADNDDEPYGVGLAHWCYWPVLFKRQGIKFWLIFLDKFGMPTTHGKFPVGSLDSEKNRLLQACEAIATDRSIITPDGMVIELIEAARSGTADYKVLHDTMNDTIAKAIIGQTASSQGTPGKLGNDELQGDVRMDIVKADADLVCESFNLGPVAWMTEFNFPGAAVPRVFRVIQEPEDANTLAERDTEVKSLGFKPSLAYIKETYGDHWEEAVTKDDTLDPNAKPTDTLDGKQPGDFAENAVRELPDAIADRLERDAGPELQRWVDRLQTAVEESSDFDAFNARLLAEYSEIPTEQLSQLVGQALLTAQLGARSQVLDEAAADDADD